MHTIKKLSLRIQTRFREQAAAWENGKGPKLAIFVHVPKTAGTSVIEYVQCCVGSRKSGRTVKLSELVRGKSIDELSILRARKARFCVGHISWETVERIRESRDAYVFTVLREPLERLWSFYNYLNVGEFPDSMIPRELFDLYMDARSWSPREFFGSTDPRLLHLVDNIMVRQLGGSLQENCEEEASASALLQAAKQNLEKLNYIGFTDGFDSDFTRIIDAIDLPAVDKIPRIKVSQPWLTTQSQRRQAFEEFRESAGSEIDRFVRWDLELYRYAQDLKRRES